MDAELAALEEKIRQVSDLCRRLRDENRELRRELATLAGDKHQLSDRLEIARTRLEALLEQIPE